MRTIVRTEINLNDKKMKMEQIATIKNKEAIKYLNEIEDICKRHNLNYSRNDVEIEYTDSDKKVKYLMVWTKRR